jgi:hypothetical protein
LTVEKGILDKKSDMTALVGGETTNYTSLKAEDKQATAIFEFGAKNTDVEFGIMKFNDGTDYVVTSHEHTNDNGLSAVLYDPVLKLNPANLIEQDHSHPDGIHYPSGRNVEGMDLDRQGDVQNAKSLEKIAPNIKFNIYTPSDGVYTPYSGSTHQPNLPAIIVTPKLKKPKNE